MSTKASDTIKLRLYYWNTRGRVQSIRYMLEDIAWSHKNVDYREDFELLEKIDESWPDKKADQTVSGPFHSLPVLHWNDTDILGQTLTIGQFLARKFDLYGKLTSAINDQSLLQGYIDGVVSCAFIDVIYNVLYCIRNNANLVDKTNPMSLLIQKILNDLKSLNDLLEKSSTVFYYDQVEPTIADYFVFEAYTIARDYHQTLMPKEEDSQALMKLEQTMKERPGLANYFSKGLLFKRFTRSPSEPEYIAKLAKI